MLLNKHEKEFKHAIKIVRELNSLCKQRNSVDPIKLDKPIQHGYVRSFELTDDTVTFTDTYEDTYGDLQTEEVVRFRTYKSLKQKQIENVKKRIEDDQKELFILESSIDHDHYRKLMRGN